MGAGNARPACLARAGFRKTGGGNKTRGLSPCLIASAIKRIEISSEELIEVALHYSE